MDPCWNDGDAKKLVDAIHGKMIQATLFRIEDEQLKPSGPPSVLTWEAPDLRSDSSALSA